MVCLVSTKKRMNFVTFFAFFKELASICHDSHINNSIEYDFHGILEVMKRVPDSTRILAVHSMYQTLKFHRSVMYHS